MNYLLVKNISLRDLLAPDGSVIKWVDFGFHVPHIKAYQAQGWDTPTQDNHLTVLPITDEAKLNAKMALLQSRIDTNNIVGDSIEIIDDATAQTYKATIQAVRNGTA